MKYFLFCMATIPFTLIGAFAIVVGALILAAGFITWDYSVMTGMFHAFIDGFSGTKFRVLYCIGLVVAFIVYTITDD